MRTRGEVGRLPDVHPPRPFFTVRPSTPPVGFHWDQLLREHVLGDAPEGGAVGRVRDRERLQARCVERVAEGVAAVAERDLKFCVPPVGSVLCWTSHCCARSCGVMALEFQVVTPASSGIGPVPINPFADWKNTSTPSGT